jgi:hypothetical protein
MTRARGSERKAGSKTAKRERKAMIDSKSDREIE